jgi:GTP-binding protein
MTVSPSSPSRTVAIVGRPNVGKSALFNRLIGRRVAIVHEESGVTRDRLIREVRREGAPFHLIDTGGIGLPVESSTPDDIQRAIKAQAEVAIQDAAVLIHVVDITAGLVPLDEEVGRRLRRSGRPVLVAANKADVPRLDAQAADFERLGHPVFALSALHNRGVEELLEAVQQRLPAPGPDASAPALRVAVIGRPNVGKSSYINRLLRSDRVIVSERPGTTRDSVEIPFAVGTGPTARRYVLIDTAGLRKKKSVHTSVEQFSVMRTESSIEQADVVVLVLDAGAGPTAGEKKLAALIQEHRRGCVLLVNKWDLAEGTGVTQRQYEAALRVAWPFLAHVPLIFVSTRTGLNIRRSVDLIDKVGGQMGTPLSTGLLNRVLQDAVRRVPPPLVSGQRLKVFYATQVGTQPARIRVFVNDPGRMAGAYRQYLVGRLRAAFGLEGAPVLLELRARPRTDRPPPAKPRYPRRKPE